MSALKLPRPAILLSFVSVLLVVAVVLFDLDAASPGALSASHAADERLDGIQGCAGCHGSDATDGTDMADACASCHAAIAEQIAAGAGFHGVLAPAADPRRCGACHLEHHGAGLALVGERAFALAGFTSRDAYDHAGLGFELVGAHAELACGECHALADVEVLPARKARFLHLEQGCTSCHDDPHDGLLSTRCADCHGQEHPFPEVAEFVHDPSFPLAGAHGALACLDCHARESDRSVELLMAARADPQRDVPDRRACSACHPSPHADRFVTAVAERFDLPIARSCERCHDPSTASGFTGDDAALDPGLHALAGFPLTAPHDALACSACHRRSEDVPRDGESFAAFRTAYPGREADACAACHADPHAGQFERGPFAGAGCLACHDRGAFLPAAFDVEVHARTSFPLGGAHLAVGCFTCHVAPEQEAGRGRAKNRFAGTPSECASCHADAHVGRFVGLDEPHAAARYRCDHCHDTQSFAGAREGFDHAAWTAFPLDGAHRAAACEDCHAPSPRPDATGRTFGFAAGTECAACHADPHAGQLALDGRTDCARCHVPSTFDDLGRFDHARDTRYPLDKTHAKVACSACHLPQPLPGGGSLVRYKPLGTQCGDCHDPRGGGR